MAHQGGARIAHFVADYVGIEANEEFVVGKRQVNCVRSNKVADDKAPRIDYFLRVDVVSAFYRPHIGLYQFPYGSFLASHHGPSLYLIDTAFVDRKYLVFHSAAVEQAVDARPTCVGNENLSKRVIAYKPHQFLHSFIVEFVENVVK